MTTVARPAQSAGAQAARLVEILKLTRSEWLTRRQIAAALGTKPDTVTKWCEELAANGILANRPGQKAEGAPGRPAKQYGLAQAWGGLA